MVPGRQQATQRTEFCPTLLVCTRVRVPIETPTYFVNDTEVATQPQAQSSKTTDCLALGTLPGNHHRMGNEARYIGELNNFSKQEPMVPLSTIPVCLNATRLYNAVRALTPSTLRPKETEKTGPLTPPRRAAGQLSWQPPPMPMPREPSSFSRFCAPRFL